jgi:O-antigen/teichoic acid export membrane protein
MSTSKSLIRNTVVNGVAAISQTIIAILVTALLLKALGAAGYGLWMMILMMSFERGYMAILDFGHGTAALQQLAVGSNQQRVRVKRELRRKYLIFSTLGIFVLLTGGRYFLDRIASGVASGDLWLFTIFMCVRLPIDMLHMANIADLESRARYPLIRLIQLTGNLLWLITALAASQFGLSVKFIAGVFLLIGVMQLTISSVVTSVRDRGFDFEITGFPTQDVDLWRNGRWVALQIGLSTIYSNMDRVIISVAVGLAAVGAYEIPYKIQALGVLILSVVPSAVFPVAARVKEQVGDETLALLFIRGTRLAVAACVPPLMALVFLAEPLVVIWVGEEYRNLADSVRLFTSWSFLGVFHVIGITMLSAIGRNREVCFLFLGTIIVNLPISIWLGMKWGINGVIIGTLSGYVIGFVPYLLVEIRTFNVSIAQWFHSVVKPFLVPATLEALFLFIVLNRLGTALNLIEVGVVGILGTAIAWASYLKFYSSSEDMETIRSAMSRSQ